jgi:hypothetical protein
MNSFRVVPVLLVVLIMSSSFQTKDTASPPTNTEAKKDKPAGPDLAPSGQPLASTKLPPIKVASFKDGEELIYTLHYGIITAGSASVKINEEKFGGQMDVFHAVGEGKTTGLANKLFKVLDIYESYFDINSNLPIKTIRNIHESNYKNFNEVYFYQHDHYVKCSKGEIHKVPENILDMVSVFFYIRRIDFSNSKPNDIISVNTFFGDEIFPFYIVFKGREEVKTDAGTFRCIRFVPVVEPGRIFKKKDDMTFWISDDMNKIPVSVKFDMIVGSFKCDLVSIKNTKYDLTSKVK